MNGGKEWEEKEKEEENKLLLVQTIFLGSVSQK